MRPLGQLRTGRPILNLLAAFAARFEAENMSKMTLQKLYQTILFLQLFEGIG